jgi:sterol desaturase/sphingolipid hydroxylase (fatty acid hydroxylase superfamily)
MTAAPAVWLVLGLFSWPALEYALHRFLGHEARFSSRFKAEHLKHHRHGDYFAGASGKLLAAVPAAATLFAGTLLLTRRAACAGAFTSGFLGCYLLYEGLHKRLHTHAPRSRLGLALRKHHLLHHFVDARVNHGVTTRLFDRLLGTLRTQERVPVPAASAPRWLMDEDGGIAAAYRSHFTLRSRD